MKHFKDKRIAVDIAQNGYEATKERYMLNAVKKLMLGTIGILAGMIVNSLWIKSMIIAVLAVILLGAMIPYVVMKEYDTEFDRKYKGKR